jgi:hypothetical protein
MVCESAVPPDADTASAAASSTEIFPQLLRTLAEAA